jgi:hypothetical protein
MPKSKERYFWDLKLDIMRNNPVWQNDKCSWRSNFQSIYSGGQTFSWKLQGIKLQVTRWRVSQCLQIHGIKNVIEIIFFELTSQYFPQQTSALLVTILLNIGKGCPRGEIQTQITSRYIVVELNIRCLLWCCYYAFEVVEISFYIHSELVGNRDNFRLFYNSALKPD